MRERQLKYYMQSYRRAVVSLKPHRISDLWLSCHPWSINEIAGRISMMPLSFLYTGTLEITVLTCKMGEGPQKT